jgi:hypothetical protein
MPCGTLPPDATAEDAEFLVGYVYRELCDDIAAYIARLPKSHGSTW